MKKNTWAIGALAITILIASCRKEDVRQENAAQNTVAVQAGNTSSWRSLGWESSRGENLATNFSRVLDSSITANVAKNGLVLVYKKSDLGIQSLPFQEKETNAYWYYQISKGTLRINSDNYGSEQNLSKQSFAYFVVTPEKLSELEAQGKSRFDLLQLSYEQAASLLK
jgi:hypothetical protein